MSQRIWRYIKILLIPACIFFTPDCFAQCPPNIGFETGSFSGWESTLGIINGADGTISLEHGTDPNRHVLIQARSPVERDPYGNFPVNSPNGGNYSIRLGNRSTGREAERVSYTFTIPANDNNYSIIYNYAVVFQNPTHADWQQPRFTANVFDVTSGKYIGCSSFSYTASDNLPGFSLSSVGNDVFYKPWTPVTIKLSGYAGRMIRLEFTTNDCSVGGHFGYAYVDVNQNCSSPVAGNVQCIGDTIQRLTAPYGFSGYRWFNADFSKELGNELTLTIKPPPAENTVLAVEITPFPDQGCIDTVYTRIVYSNQSITLNTPSSNIVSCIFNPPDLTSSLITTGSSPGIELSYFTDATLANYVPVPGSITQSGTYYIKAVNAAGCTAMKPITIRITNYPAFTISDPPTIRRPYLLDLTATISGDTGGVTFTYWKDELATIPLSNPEAIDRSGKYFIKAAIEGGCHRITGVNVTVEEALIVPPNAFSPNGDGIHDEWEIPLLSSLYTSCTVDIYNRLGQLVFHSVGYGKKWDGKYKGITQPVATYYYVIRPRPDLPPVGGSVTIVR